MPIKRKPKKEEEKPKHVFIAKDKSQFGEVLKIRHGKSAFVMHGVKFSPPFNMVWACFSPDGTRLCTASEDRSARIYSMETGKQLKIFEHGDWLRTAKFNPEGTHICTACLDGKARIWNIETGVCEKSFLCGKKALDATFSPDGRFFATASWDKTVRLYFVPDWEDALGSSMNTTVKGKERAAPAPAELVVFRYIDEAWNVNFSADNQRLCTACGDCFARIHAVTEPPPPLPEGVEAPKIRMRKLELEKFKIDELKARLRKFELEDRGKKAEMIERLKEAGGDETPEEPPPDPTRELNTFEHKDKVQYTQFSKDGLWLVTACRDKVARIFDIDTGQVLASYGHMNWIPTLQLSEDQTVLCTCCDDGFVRMWDVKAEKELMAFDLDAPVTCAAFSPDNKQFCSASKSGAAQVFGLLPE